jgi:hypothetical protein
MNAREDAAFWVPVISGIDEAVNESDRATDLIDANGDNSDNDPQLVEEADVVVGNVVVSSGPKDETTGVVDERSVMRRAKDALSRHKGKLYLGAIAASAALTFMNNPATEVAQDVVEAAPVVGGALIASEAMFIGGGIMMVSATGRKVGNPLKLKDKIPEIATAANDSWLFKSGLAINTIGAFGTAGAVVAGTLMMPEEAYLAALAFATADVALTISVRKAIINGIRNNRIVSPDEQSQPES